MGISDYSNSIYDPGVRSIKETLNHKEKDLKQMTATTDPSNNEAGLEIQEYVRKPFFVRGAQVTDDNIELVAKWCGGKLHVGQNPGDRSYISVKVPRAMNERQTMAYVGDWVLSSGSGHKVYTKNAFDASFRLRTDNDASVEADLVQKSRESVEPTEESAKRLTDLETGATTLIPGTTPDSRPRSELAQEQYGDPKTENPIDWTGAVLHEGIVPTPPRVYKSSL